LQLQRLVLDHSLLSDEGISTLASGLSCCSSLKVLSLRYCNIGAAGAQQLAEALVPACKHHGMEGGPVAAATGVAASRMSLSCVNPQLAPMAAATPAQAAGITNNATNMPMASSGTTPSSSTASGTSSKQPTLQQLHLDGNPLGAAGLHAVSKAVRWMTGIKVLTLADIHLDCSMHADQLEVQVLAHSLLTGPHEINTLDFTDNHISKWGQRARLTCRPICCGSYVWQACVNCRAGGTMAAIVLHSVAGQMLVWAMRTVRMSDMMLSCSCSLCVQ
jgi:hypothetical protein